MAGRRVTCSREARERFLSFALSPAALWAGNFRDLNAAVAGIATLAPGGRISNQVVDEETNRLSVTWHKPETTRHDDELGQFLTPKQLEEIDLFDRAQLAFVIDSCTRGRSLSEAGRSLFSASPLASRFETMRIGSANTSVALVWNFSQIQKLTARS
jgi:transcriptional regulatory protein RtcR